MKVIADANVLLSCVLGGRARLILDHPDIEEILTTRGAYEEVQEYAVVLGRKKKFVPEILMMAVAALPVTIIPREQFEASVPAARKQIEWRDPDDVELLALALHMNLPLWTNDRDFENCGIQRFTTAELLSYLGITTGS